MKRMRRDSGRMGNVAGVGGKGAKAEDFSGAVPGEWCLRRVAQIGAGKIFGSVGFVVSAAFSLGDRFRAGAGPHPVGEVGYSTHGWRLAKAAARGGEFA